MKLKIVTTFIVLAIFIFPVISFAQTEFEFITQFYSQGNTGTPPYNFCIDDTTFRNTYGFPLEQPYDIYITDDPILTTIEQIQATPLIVSLLMQDNNPCITITDGLYNFGDGYVFYLIVDSSFYVDQIPLGLDPNTVPITGQNDPIYLIAVILSFISALYLANTINNLVKS